MLSYHNSQDLGVTAAVVVVVVMAVVLVASQWSVVSGQ